MVLFVVACRRCGAAVATGIRTGKVADPLLGPHEVRCARCGHAARYQGRDFTAAAAGA